MVKGIAAAGPAGSFKYEGVEIRLAQVEFQDHRLSAQGRYVFGAVPGDAPIERIDVYVDAIRFD